MSTDIANQYSAPVELVYVTEKSTYPPYKWTIQYRVRKLDQT